MRFFFTMVTLSSAVIVAACRPTTEGRSRHLYLGQDPPGELAEVFAPEVVSLPGRYEYALAVSPDAEELYFSAEVPGGRSQIMAVRFEDGTWAEPRALSLTDGIKAYEMEAFLSPNGQELFFTAFDSAEDSAIWSARRSDGGWGEARRLASPINSAPAFYSTFAADGTLYFTRIFERKILRARSSGGSYSEVEDAGLPPAGHAFVAPDGSYLLLDGGGEIHVSFSLDGEGWSEPQRLGPEVNTADAETCPSVSPDGQYLFFSRYPAPDEISDIYWVSSSVIDRYR